MWLEKDMNPGHPGTLLREICTRFSQFRGGHQCDVQEAVLCIIDILEKSIGREALQEIFYGRQVQVVAWPNGSKTSQDELFASLILYPTENNMHLNQLIKKYEEIQLLEGYTDDEGKTWPIAGTQTKISYEPKILMITIHGKQNVELPEILRDKYHLFSVAVHNGSQHGGHYHAMVKHRGQWYEKDDTIVREMETFPVRGPYYFCMYKR
jgi:ubiquitin C-terminal hydrolase